MSLRIAVATAVAALLVVGLNTDVGDAAPATLARATTTQTVRPVTASGRPAAGYTVRHEGGSADCSFPDASPAARDNDILFCAPSAAFALACWRSATRGYVLCLQRPAAHWLARLRVSGIIAHTRRPHVPIPLTMKLANGASCLLRDGGTGSRLRGHPGWGASYYCTENLSVWAHHSSGIDRSSKRWTVRVAPSSGNGALRRAHVVHATFVGTKPGPRPKTDGSWTSPRVIIHPYGIGKARFTMSRTRLRQVTHARRFVNGEDGVVYTYGTPGFGVGQSSLPNSKHAFGCFFAYPGRLDPDIVTDRGAALGDSLARLKQVYGHRLHYTRGVETQVGRIPGRYVRTSRGTLFFYLQYGYVYSISALAPGEPLKPC